MKRIILILFIIIMFAAILIILCGCGQSGTNIATDNSSTELEIIDLMNALEKEGLTVTSTQEKYYTLIGASDGIGYHLNNGDYIEIYKMNPKSSNELTIQTIKEYEKKNSYNKSVLIINNTANKEYDKIQDIFNNL